LELENPLNSCTLLYVEDDRDTRNRVIPFLAPRVKTLWVAENGEKGLELFEKCSPDIVVTDLGMPKMDGIQMARAIRAIDEEIPIIMTASFSEDYRLCVSKRSRRAPRSFSGSGQDPELSRHLRSTTWP